MEYKDLTKDLIIAHLKNILSKPSGKSMKMFTNDYGMEQFEDAMLFQGTGLRKIYFGIKLPRYIKNANLEIKLSKYTKRYYKYGKTQS